MFLCELFNNSFNFVAIVRKHCLKINLSVSLFDSTRKKIH